jgi:hypothetical protein
VAVIVETGKGQDPTANAYISVADCDAYHALRNRAAWTGTTAIKEAAIIAAADYLNFNYEWKGDQRYDYQPLRWPRSFGYVDVAYPLIGLEDIVPIEVVKANAELALLALAGDLYPATTGAAVQSETKSIAGALSKSTTYRSYGGYANERHFPFVDRMLSRVATGGSSGVRYIRVDRA